MTIGSVSRHHLTCSLIKRQIDRNFSNWRFDLSGYSLSTPNTSGNQYNVVQSVIIYIQGNNGVAACRHKAAWASLAKLCTDCTLLVPFAAEATHRANHFEYLVSKLANAKARWLGAQSYHNTSSGHWQYRDYKWMVMDLGTPVIEGCCHSDLPGILLCCKRCPTTRIALCS